MSIINIVYHDENIYSVAQKEQIAVKKPPRYHSRFGPMVRAERKAVLDDHRTMGFAEVPITCPKHFLRKGCGPHCVVPASPRQCLLEGRKPPVPKRTCSCKGPCEQKPCRNFRLENIKRVVSAVPIRPKPRYCDTRHGDFHDLQKSGLVPIYVFQEKFGKCPGYIVKRRQMEAKKELKAKDEAIEKQPKCRFVTSEEREKILGGLKQNWEELQKHYQGLPLMIDTIPKMIRKTKLENTLKDLERDIMLMENNPYIYVFDEH